MKNISFTRFQVGILLFLIGALLVFFSLYVYKNIPYYGSSISGGAWAAYQESLTLKHTSLFIGLIGALAFSIGSSLAFHELSRNGWFFIITGVGLFGIIVGFNSFAPEGFKHYMPPPIPISFVLRSFVQTLGLLLSITMFVYGLITVGRTWGKKEETRV